MKPLPKKFLTLFQIALTVAALVFVIRRVDVDALAAIGDQVSYGAFIVAICAMSLGANLLNAWKMLLILRSASVSLAAMVRINFISALAGFLLPGGIGKDAARMLLLRNKTGALRSSLRGVGADRLSSLWLQGVIVTVLFMGWSSYGKAVHRLLWGSAVLAVLCAGGWVLLRYAEPAALWITNVFKPGTSPGNDTAASRPEPAGGGPARYLSVLSLTGLSQVFHIALIFWFARICGYPVTLFEASVLFFMNTILHFLPLAFGGFGVIEGVYMVFFRIFTQAEAAGLAVSLMLRLSVVVSACIGAVTAAFKTKEWHAFKEEREKRQGRSMERPC